MNQQQSTEEYLTYQQFNDMALAEATAQKLTSSGISNSIHDGSKAYDVSFANNTVINTISLKLKGSDFPRADAVLGNLLSKHWRIRTKAIISFNSATRNCMR